MPTGDLPGWRQGYYQPSNLPMSDGMLRILLRRDKGTTESAAPYRRMDPLT